jgi:hypothetical protein
MAAAFGAPLLGTALVVISGFYRLPGQETRVGFLSIMARVSKWITKAVPSDTAGKLREVIFRPGGATETSRWWSEAQPPGQVEEDCSRPGRDAGPEFAVGPIPVRRPFKGRVVLSRRFRWLRFAPPPANIPRASGALGVCQQYPEQRRPKGSVDLIYSQASVNRV